uniref:Arginine biosynthesis bifunctional protein ArgJ n=1 Tax=Desulfatirhabdium butyrativorans TaxID=340467 RepID=A0A7C4MPA0_9BACT
MSVRYTPGFRAAGIAAGIKKNGRPDLGLIVSDSPATAAGMFTRNRVKAAPVLIDMERIGSGSARAILVNSGCANCCTGEVGREHALTSIRAVAEVLDIAEDQVLVASTGVIGQPLPIEKVLSAIPALVKGLSAEGFPNLAEAMMTTDTVPKCVVRSDIIAGRAVSLTGVAKGAGMIRPDMATLLCFLVTDASVNPARLHAVLKRATDASFNRITIDGDTSTNDTAILLANGASGLVIDDDTEPRFQELVTGVMVELAKMLVRDGEGATKLVEIQVCGAPTASDARTVADTIANSPLVKTAIFGEDANWGRILAAAGRSGVLFDPDRIEIRFDDVIIYSQGRGGGGDVEQKVTAVLKRPEFCICVDLHEGSASSSVWTCDFSVDYVRINADYRS